MTTDNQLSLESEVDLTDGQTQPVAVTVVPENKTGNKEQRISPTVVLVSMFPPERMQRINTAFLKTRAGLLKVAGIVCAAVCYVLSLCQVRYTAAGWVEFAAYTAMLVPIGLTLLYVLFPHISQDNHATRDGLLAVELIYYSMNVFMFFVGFWLMISAVITLPYIGSTILTAIFCVVLTILSGVEAYFKFQEWRVETSPGAMTHNGARMNGNYEHAPPPPHPYMGAPEQ